MPLSFMLIPYSVVIIFVIAVTGAAIYHIVRFDLVNVITMSVMVVYCIAILIIVGVTVMSLRDVSWTETVITSPNSPTSIQRDTVLNL